MEDIKIEILPNLYLKEDGTFDLEKALQMSGKIAGLCYAKTSFHDILEEDKDKTLRRIENTLNNGHHSVYDHIWISFYIKNIPKILAMVLNNEKQYTTSEKSLRYTPIDDSVDVSVEDKKAYYIDILNAGINGRSPLATSKILLNYIRNVKLDTKNVTKELDRITMMMLIFETLFNKEFYYITYYEYMSRAEKIKTLMDLVSYYELIRTNQKNIDMPYLHEIISDCDVKKYKKEMR